MKTGIFTAALFAVAGTAATAGGVAPVAQVSPDSGVIVGEPAPAINPLLLAGGALLLIGGALAASSSSDGTN
ncbi:hypothetical protein K3728_04525 [Rhodobacteraceae bacterium M385]|nr:hypothetical protein K3728_04525 [Rhodobacteraceae bacterium M385]